MKRINALTSKKMYMFTLFKDSMLILVCICIVIPSKLLKAAEHLASALQTVWNDHMNGLYCSQLSQHKWWKPVSLTYLSFTSCTGSLWIFSIFYLTMELVWSAAFRQIQLWFLKLKLIFFWKSEHFKLWQVLVHITTTESASCVKTSEVVSVLIYKEWD